MQEYEIMLWKIGIKYLLGKRKYGLNKKFFIFSLKINMEILKKYIWGTVATLILIVFLIILQKYQDASQRSYHFESKLDEVQKETCY